MSIDKIALKKQIENLSGQQIDWLYHMAVGIIRDSAHPALGTQAAELSDDEAFAAYFAARQAASASEASRAADAK